MAEPLFAGAVHETASWRSLAVSAGAAGAAGAPAVAQVEADQALSPCVFPARTCTW